MPTATYSPVPTRDMLADTDACDNEYWEGEIDANKSNPVRAKEPFTAAMPVPDFVRVSPERVRWVVGLRAADHKNLRLAACHPNAPADWITGVALSAPSVDSCDIVYNALRNPCLDWNTLRTIYWSHRHDSVVYENASFPVHLIDECSPFTMAGAVIRNWAAPPDLVADAISMFIADDENRILAEHLTLREILHHPNATAEDITTLAEHMMDRFEALAGSGDAWLAEQVFDKIMRELHTSGGYVFGTHEELNAGGRVGCLDRWYSIQIVKAATEY